MLLFSLILSGIAQENQHSLLQQGVDKFCTATNIVDDICTIKARSIRLTSNTVYESKHTMIFDNSNV